MAVVVEKVAEGRVVTMDRADMVLQKATAMAAGNAVAFVMNLWTKWDKRRENVQWPWLPRAEDSREPVLALMAAVMGVESMIAFLTVDGRHAVSKGDLLCSSCGSMPHMLWLGSQKDRILDAVRVPSRVTTTWGAMAPDHEETMRRPRECAPSA
ncbi:hypothetical protein BDZ45DRAFT_690734 [Acephala macrosclerotiorum]|nr:hypothetical protein BDZ45DRAFT_690734 [Acephala macrosclerotiorum]